MKHENGYILVDCLIGLSIWTVILALGISALTNLHWGPSYLDQETELLAWHIRRVQLASLYGYIDIHADGLSGKEPIHPSLWINGREWGTKNYRSSYRGQFTDLVKGPPATISLQFNRWGKPSHTNPIRIQDKENSHINQIVLAAMTGRLRWESIR